MAIGTAAAIGLGVAGVGSFLGGKSASKAASKAADTSLAVAQQNNALARDIYGQNKQVLSPFVGRGNVAGDHINALLGLGGAPAQQQSTPTAQPNVYAPYNAGYPGETPYRMGSYYGGREPNIPRLANDNFFPSSFYNNTNATAAPTGRVNALSPQQAANNAFDIYRNSTGYQFRLGEGQNALNSGYAGAGILQSGDAMRAATEYGQNFASNEFGNYLGYLSNQQGVGLSGASALAGVGQNYVNNVSANNNSAGSAAANASLVKGANNPFVNALGTIGGGLLGGAF